MGHMNIPEKVSISPEHAAWVLLGIEPPSRYWSVTDNDHIRIEKFIEKKGPELVGALYEALKNQKLANLSPASIANWIEKDGMEWRPYIDDDILFDAFPDIQGEKARQTTARALEYERQKLQKRQSKETEKIRERIYRPRGQGIWPEKRNELLRREVEVAARHNPRVSNRALARSLIAQKKPCAYKDASKTKPLTAGTLRELIAKVR